MEQHPINNDEFSPDGGGRMLEPPVAGAVLVTIDDAELAGWMHMAIHCQCGETHYPWRLLRQRTRYRRLDEIATRLKCKRCGCRPDRVWLLWRGGRDATEVLEKTILSSERPE